MSSVFSMVSSVVLFVACLFAVASAAPQLRAAIPPAVYRQFGLPALSYPGASELPYNVPLATARNLPLTAPLVYRQPAVAPRTAAIISQSQDVSFDGTFSYGFESEDGTSVQTSGAQIALGPEEPGQATSGTYSYVSPDGTPITTNWYADQTGFHAEGAHLPKGPEGHVRSL